MTSAVLERTGLRCEIEKAPEAFSGQRLSILLQLPGLDGGGAPVVALSRAGGWREHRCPKAFNPAARSFSAANFNRKRRT